MKRKSAVRMAAKEIISLAELRDEQGHFEEAKNCRKLAADLLREDRERVRMERAIRWVLGGPGSNFRTREPGEGAYWWRTELSKRAFGKRLSKHKSERGT